jgi:hypothetical protein
VGATLIGSDEEQAGRSTNARLPAGGAAGRVAAWPVPSSRRRDVAPGHDAVAAEGPRFLLLPQVTAAIGATGPVRRRRWCRPPASGAARSRACGPKPPSPCAHRHASPPSTTCAGSHVRRTSRGRLKPRPAAGAPNAPPRRSTVRSAARHHRRFKARRHRMPPEIGRQHRYSRCPVADADSFTVDSPRLNRTRSTVSIQIELLGDLIDKVVLGRTSRKVRGTSAGDILLADPRRLRLLRLHDEALAHMSA